MGREGHYIIAPKRLDEGLHHQNSLKSVLEGEGEISSTLYTKWRALYMKCTVHVIESEYVLCYILYRLVEAGKRGFETAFYTYGVWMDGSCLQN